MSNSDTTISPRLGLPYIQPSQAQKHITVNEGLRLIDALSHLAVKSIGMNTPPEIPETGDRYIIGSEPQGLWQGEAGALAIWDVDAWRFSRPREGWRAWDQTEKEFFVYDGELWGVVGGASIAGESATEFVLPLLPGFALHRQVFEYSFDVDSETELITSAFAPKDSLALGVTAKVIHPLKGITKWRMGISGTNQNSFYAYWLSPDAGTKVVGLAETVMRCHSKQPVLITRETGVFTTGTIAFTQYTLRGSVV
jgi:hypothetical protein